MKPKSVAQIFLELVAAGYATDKFHPECWGKSSINKLFKKDKDA